MKKRKRRPYRTYNDEFKHHVIKQVITGQLTRAEAQRKYNLGGHGHITTWMRNLGYLNPTLLPVKSQPTKPADEQPDGEQPKDNSSLKKQNKELKQLLKQEQMRSEFYEQIIDTAERELGVAIRKKSDAK